MTKPMHIHFIGIGGTGMGALAGLCHQAGHTVTGTDGPIYPPMSTYLASLGITPFEDYQASHLNPRPDLVIIGNVIRRDNPEAQTALQQGLRYLSMPDAIAELFLKNRHPVVITGTHGKTTMSSILAWLLEHAGRDPSFMIGGIPLNFGSGALDDGKGSSAGGTNDLVGGNATHGGCGGGGNISNALSCGALQILIALLPLFAIPPLAYKAGEEVRLKRTAIFCFQHCRFK